MLAHHFLWFCESKYWKIEFTQTAIAIALQIKLFAIFVLNSSLFTVPRLRLQCSPGTVFLFLYYDTFFGFLICVVAGATLFVFSEGKT